MELKEIIKNSDLHISKEKISYEEPMKNHTSFKVGGSAEVFVKVENEEQLKEIQAFASNNKIPMVLIGNGSNILVTDKGIRGIVVKIDIKKLDGIVEWFDDLLHKYQTITRYSDSRIDKICILLNRQINRLIDLQNSL